MAPVERTGSEAEDGSAGAPESTGRESTGPETGGPETGGRETSGRETSGLSAADIRDQLPADLDASGFVGPYMFPNNSRRRVPGVLYLLIAAALVALWVLAGDSPLVNGGYLLAAGLLTVAGAYSLASGWNLAFDERDALVAATAEAGFAVGHASAQMGWRGLLSRPTWRILLYSAENPPTRRGLVLVDGVDGAVIDRIIEDNPEDWSELDGRLSDAEP